MSIALTNRAESLKRALPIILAAAALLAVAGFIALQTAQTQQASAAKASDFALNDGDRITAHTAVGDPDIFVVKEDFQMAHKRNFQNVAICKFYGQFGTGGCFAAGLKQVSATVRDAFPTSCYYTNAETKDGKVWLMQATGPDSGTLRHVQVSGSDAVAADQYFFNKVFNMNSLEQNYYPVGTPITAMSQVPTCVTGESTTPTPVPGALSVTLAPGNPAAQTITRSAAGVEFLRVRFTGTGTISTITFKRTGPGAAGDFSNVYVYDGATRLTSGKSLSSSDGTVTFISLDTAVSGTKDLSVVADMASGTVGDVNAMQLTTVTLTSGTVSGLPITGNNMVVSGTTSGRLDVAKVGSGFLAPKVGQKGAQLSEFKLTSNTEGSYVKRITLLQGGTVKASDITNVKIKTGTTEWSGTVTSKGYLVFDMGTGHFIAKGGDSVFKVYGDLAGKKDEDINLYFEYASDLYAIGDLYGFGMNTASGTANQGIDAFDAATEAHDVTLAGGVLTIAYNGPSAGNIGTNTSDTTLLRISMTAASNIEVRKTELTLCHDPSGDGSFAAGADTDSGWSDITDIKMTDESSGVSVIGPQDGSAFTTSDAGTCEDAVTGAQKSFTDVFELMGGTTYNFKITADVNTANTDGNGLALSAGDAIQLWLDDYTDDTPDVTVMKYSGTNTSVADADIVPQADTGGGIQTLQASSLTLGLSGTVADTTYVRGTQGVNAAAFTFKAANASELKVTDIVLSGYADDDNSGNYTLGAEAANGITVAGLVSQVKLYEAESGTLLASAPASNQLSNATGTVTFNSLTWTIPAGATKTLLVKVDLSGNPTSSTNDYFAFDIAATTDVTALDNASRTVNAANSDINSSAGTVSDANSVKITVANAGSIAAAISTANSPADHAVYWGQTGDSAGVWRFTSTNEAYYLERLQFGEDDTSGTQETDLAANTDKVYLEYKNEAGATLTASGTLSSVGTVSFGFSGTDRPYVPKDSSLDVTLKIDYKTKSQGATSGKTWDLAFMPNTCSNTNCFKAVGAGSGVATDGQDTGFTAAADQDTSGTDIINYRVFPEITQTVPSTTKVGNSNPVMIFTVTAKGLPGSQSTLFFDNTAAGSGSIKFEVVASGVGTNNVLFTVKDAADNTTIDQGSITNATLTYPKASLTIDFGLNNTGKDIEISGGSSKTFKVFIDDITTYFGTIANTTNGVAADYFQLVLRDDEAGLVNWVDNSTNASGDLDTASTAGYLRQLEMIGSVFTP